MFYYTFFYQFLCEKLPQTTIYERQILIKNLLSITFANYSSTSESSPILPTLKYCINGISSGSHILKSNKIDTIWTLNNYELSNYLSLNIIDNNKLWTFKENIRSQYIKLLCSLMKRCDPSWFRNYNNNAYNSLMWNIFQNYKKNNIENCTKICLTSQIYACKAVETIGIFFSDSKYVDAIYETLMRKLPKYNCRKHILLLKSTFCKFLSLQLHTTHKTECDTPITGWLTKLIANLINISSWKDSYYVITRTALFVFLKYRNELSKYWSTIFHFFRVLLRDLSSSERCIDLSLSYRIMILESIRTF